MNGSKGDRNPFNTQSNVDDGGLVGMPGGVTISILLMIVLLMSTSATTVSEELILVADEWCPYNCAPGSDRPGFMVEIAQHALAKEGHTVVYKTVPWARAIANARLGLYQGIIGAGREETPDFVFPEIESGHSTHTFYVKRGNAWRFEGLESLESVNLGAIIHYSYGGLFSDYILPNKDKQNVQVIGGENTLGRNIKKLITGRIDVLIEDKAVFQHHLFITSTLDQFQVAGVSQKEKVYIAFSPNNGKSKHYAQIINSGMKELRESGRLKRILEKYGVSDWR
ncbi:amino acid ABC transporter substrate-binding protein [Pseudomaricurvus alkylphenolicus]|uniref:substrate-binding periplasmic protein n=1 Tax=Pseudomaricurvus alkylphenolicus TaxID=1306991 RepID=UPI001423F45E|nr:transporter substrate-binding domain-containing protein [Pseudomaricurvus alkylphenolicus]NIB43456.1 amino acid ABC transporter substrate-binding protein [Pseudomaricurvus alkylphenolicus]